MDSGNDLGNIGSQLGHILRIEVVDHGLVQRPHDAFVAAVDEVVPLIQVALGILDPLFGSVNIIHQGFGHDARQGGADCGHTQLIHFGDLLAHFRDGFRCAGDLRGQQDVHGTVLVQDGHILGPEHVGGDSGDRDLFAVLPVFHPGLAQHTAGIFIHFGQPDDAFHLDLVVPQPAAVSQQIIPGQAHLHVQGGLLHACGFLVFRDVGSELPEELGLVTTSRLGELGHDTFHLGGGQRRHIHVFGFSVFGDQANDISGLQGSGGSAACDLLIGHDEGRHRFRRQPGGIDLVVLQVFEHIGGDLAGLQLGDVGAGCQFLVGTDHGGHISGIQPGHIGARGSFGIGLHISHQPGRSQGGFIRTFRLLSVLCYKGIHQRLLFGRVLCFRISLNDRVRGDRAGIAGPFIPASLRSGHVQIGGDLQDFLTDSLAEHLVQAGQVGVPFVLVQVGLDRGQLLQRGGEVDIREHGLYLGFRHSAVQQGLDLGQQRDIFCQSTFIHAGGQLVQLRQEGFLLSVSRSRAVLPEQLHQVADLCFCGLDITLLPHRHHDVGHQLGVFHGSSPAVTVVLGVQSIQCLLTLRAVLNQLDQGIFLVVLLVQRGVDGGHALGGSDHGVFIYCCTDFLSTGFCTGHFGFHLVPDGVEAVCVGCGQVVFDLNGLAGVDELLQADFIAFRQLPVLLLIQQPGDLLIHGVKGINVGPQLCGNGRIARLVGCFLQAGELLTGAGGQALEGVRPFRNDLVGFLLAVRPDIQQAVQPFAAVPGCPLEVILAHAEEGQALAAAVEGFGSGFLPGLGGLRHAFQRFSGSFRAGRDVHQLHRTVHQRSGKSNHSYLGGSQYLHQPADPAARHGDGSGELADGREGLSQGSGDGADRTHNLAQNQHDGADSGGKRGPFHNGLTLHRIQRQELLQQGIGLVDDLLDCRIQVIADLPGEHKRRVLQVCQPGFRGSIPLVGFIGQGGILSPCPVGGLLCSGEKLRRIGGAQQGVTKADFLDADFFQSGDCAFAFLIHFGKTDDEGLEGRCGIAVPQSLELLGCHAGDLRKVLQGIASSRRRNFHFHQRFGESGTAHLGFNADRGKRRSKAQNLRFRQTDLLARASKAHGHGQDFGFCGSVIIAQIHQRGAEILELPLAHAHDVGKPGRFTGGIRSDHVCAVSQVDHGAGKFSQVLILNAQLACNGHDLCDILCGRGNLRAHLLDGL